MTVSRLIDDEELWAYVDGALTPERRAEISKVLADDRRLSEKVAAMRRQNEILRSVGADVLHEPVPERLLDVLCKARTIEAEQDAPSSHGPATTRRVLTHVLCGLLGLVIGLAAGQWGGWS